MASFNIFLERERLEKFDYSIRPEVESFMKKMFDMGILLENKPECTNDDEIVTSTEILKINIPIDSRCLDRVNYMERYFNLTRAKNEELINDIIYYVFQDYLCDIVDYIEAVKVIGEYTDKDLIIDANDIKKMNFKDFKDGNVAVEFDATGMERIYSFTFCRVKDANGLDFEDGDSSGCNSCTLEHKKMHALWIIKRWFTMLVYGYYEDESDYTSSVSTE